MEQLFGGGILWTLLIGFVCGLLARAIKPGRDKLGIIMTILLGIGGALLARFVGDSMGWFEPEQPIGFLASLVGAIVLLVIYALVRGKSR
jgi:uncharacterized membrane protein YeaQ/YmgE (transglycosylase-associated protein family)